MGNLSSEVWQVILVDVNEKDYLLTREKLAQAQGHEIKLEWASSYQTAEQLLETNRYDAVLVDYKIGQRSGIELIREAVVRGYPAPLILYADQGSYEIDVEAMEAGATLYLTKGDANPLTLERFIRYAIERKRIETQLDRNLQERLIILESIQDGLFGIDRDWRITYINHRAARTGGFEPAELTGRNLWELFPRLKGTVLEENYRRVMTERTLIQFEMRGAYTDQWYNIAVYPSAEGISVYWQDITERIRAEVELRKNSEALRESERRFMAVFQNAPFAITLSGASDGIYVDVNPAWEKLFGFEKSEVIGKTGPELGIVMDLEAKTHILNQFRQTGFMRNQEILYRKKAGDPLIISMSADLITIGEKEFRLSTMENITERKRAEEALRESEATLREQEEMLRLSLVAGQAGAWSWDLTTNVLHWSDEYYRIFGFEPGSIQPSAEAGFEHVHPDDLARIDGAVSDAIERGTQIDEVHRVIWPDGSIHWVRGISRAFFNEQGKPVRMAGIAMDMTEQKQAERDLQAAHRQTVEILESISDAFYSLDQEQRFTYVNQKAAGLWKKQPEELLGKNIWEVFPSGKGTESYQKFQQALTDRQLTHYESYSAYLDEWVDIHLYPTEQGISVYFQDITERKQAEATLAVYAQDLERSNRDLQEFVFVASHDLQEPLRKIEVLGDLLHEKSANMDDQQRGLAARMRKSAQRMRGMVDGMLQLSRLEMNAQPFQQVNLKQTIQEVLVDLELQIQGTQGIVEICDLPVIDADPLQMRRLFQNLIGNALKFQPEGGKPRVNVCAEQPSSGKVHILVADNGIGFDEKHATHLFKPFKRLVGKTEFEGSGMGLAICRKIVERHNGDITVSSKPGQGTIFVVNLPVHQKQSTHTIRRIQDNGGQTDVSDRRR